jgi:hypothetical protein
MADVFARVQRELQDRLAQVEAELATAEGLRTEKARIEHALAVPPFATGAPAAPARTARRASRSRTPKPRAPRGANRAAVYTALDRMPGASAGEIAAAARVGSAQVYALLRAGVEQGELKAVELGGGHTGYQSARPVETAFPSAAAAGTDSAPAATSERVSGPSATPAAIPIGKPRRGAADAPPDAS